MSLPGLTGLESQRSRFFLFRLLAGQDLGRAPLAGRVLNAKTARRQLMGGMLWEVGQSLLEVTHMDPWFGRWANMSLGDYLVAVNADAPDVDVEFVDVRDDEINSLGAAAIANAVFHATGRRVLALPIRIEHLL